MASRRAALSLVQTSSAHLARAANRARVRATTQLCLRRHHSRVQLRQPPQSLRLLPRWSAQQCPASCAAQSLSFHGRPAAAGRSYSTEAEGKQSKIWDFEALQKLITNPSSSITIIDVREPGELQQTGRIPGALNVPVTSAPDSFHIGDDEFEDRFGFPRPARDAEVVFYCRAGVRGRAAAGLAREAGWTRVGEYPGSWLDWFEKGGPVER